MARKSADAAMGAAKAEPTNVAPRKAEWWCWCRPLTHE
jgi:hypothetical protein